MLFGDVLKRNFDIVVIYRPCEGSFLMARQPPTLSGRSGIIEAQMRMMLFVYFQGFDMASKQCRQRHFVLEAEALMLSHNLLRVPISKLARLFWNNQNFDRNNCYEPLHLAAHVAATTERQAARGRFHDPGCQQTLRLATADISIPACRQLTPCHQLRIIVNVCRLRKLYEYLQGTNCCLCLRYTIGSGIE